MKVKNEEEKAMTKEQKIKNKEARKGQNMIENEGEGEVMIAENEEELAIEFLKKAGNNSVHNTNNQAAHGEKSKKEKKTYPTKEEYENLGNLIITEINNNLLKQPYMI